MKMLPVTAAFHLAFLTMAFAQDAPAQGIEITGSAIKAGVMTVEELSSLPTIEQQTTYETSKGTVSGSYEGPLLWSILEARGIGDAPGHNAQLKHALIVEGRDGYRILFSVGEIDPDFGNASIQLATEKDGKALPGAEGYRLIVPGDKRGARYVRDVVRIDVQ